MSKSSNSIRALAIAILIAGAAASAGMVYYMGRNNKSVLLILIFVAWVLGPFVALIGAHVISKRLPVRMRVTLPYHSFFITFASVVAYSGILLPQGTKPAFIFIVMPVFSWVVMIITFFLAASRSKKVSQKNAGDSH
jgi:hypothetical protein